LAEEERRRAEEARILWNGGEDYDDERTIDHEPMKEVATPPTMIEHAAAVASEPEPVASSPTEAPSVVPEPESAVVRHEREMIDAWIRNRLIAYPLASCLLCRKPIIAGQDWQESSNGEARARFHRACHIGGGLGRKRRRGRRWGSRFEPSQYCERSRRMRVAEVAVWLGPTAAAVGRASLRAICAAAAGCAGTPSAMIVAEKFINREASQNAPLGLRLRGFLSFDDRRARIIGWEMFERADALLHEALGRDECPSSDCGERFPVAEVRGTLPIDFDR
jgi:hypothetical protein